MAELGIAFDVHVPSVTEVFYPDDPRRTAIENARHKHDECLRRFGDHIIITADTVVAYKGKCVTKPASLSEAASFLRLFSGQPQVVHTAVAMSVPRTHPEVHLVDSTVIFRDLDDAVITNYLSKVTPLDKAGGYDINQHGDLIIKSYSGSYTNIMGLPKETVAAWLTQEGYL